MPERLTGVANTESLANLEPRRRNPVVSPMGETIVDRARLFDLLELSARITLVTAGAGFGKTTLVSQWLHRSEQSYSWLTLTAEDRDPTVFGLHIQEALGHLQHTRDISVLVLDNADDACLDGLNQALIDLPPLLHVIVLSRRSLPLRLGRLRAAHHVCEIREQDLRFTPAEAYALLETMIRTRLTRDDIRTLWSVTRGWVAGMMLAISVDFTLKREAIPLEREWWRTWDGYLDSYYQEEVLAVLPDDIQQSLLAYADLPLLTADLCASIAGGPEGAIAFDRLVSNVTLMVEDSESPGRYSIDPLFAVALRRLRPDSMAPDLPDRAAVVEWLLERQELRAAAELSVQVGEPDLIRRTHGVLGAYLAQRSMFDELEFWLGRLPASLRAGDLDLDYWLIVARLGFGRTVETATMLEAAAPRMVATGSVLHIGRLMLARGLLAFHLGDGTLAIDQLTQALTLLPETALVERAYAENTLGKQYFRDGQDHVAEPYLERAERLLRRLPIDEMWAWQSLAMDRADAYATRGDLHSASTKYRMILAELPETHQQLEGLIRSRLVALELERNHLEEAAIEYDRVEQLLVLGGTSWRHDAALARMRAMLDQRERISGRNWRHDAALAHVRLLLAQGDQMEAEGWGGGYLKLMRRLPQKDQMVLALAYMWLERGELPMVRSWLSDMGPLQYSWVRAFGDINPVLLEIDLRLAEGRGRDAALRAQEMVDQSRQRQRISELTSFLLRLAIARRMEGDNSRAYQALSEAVHIGLAGGFVRSMVVPGYHLPTYFGEMWESVRHAPEVRARFQELPFETDDVQSAPFTPRETEVLNLVARGMSNKQIATTLFISVNTVRNHLVRMSKRLETRSRTELVAKARTIGALA